MTKAEEIKALRAAIDNLYELIAHQRDQLNCANELLYAASARALEHYEYGGWSRTGQPREEAKRERDAWRAVHADCAARLARATEPESQG